MRRKLLKGYPVALKETLKSGGQKALSLFINVQVSNIRNRVVSCEPPFIFHACLESKFSMIQQKSLDG